MFRSLLSITLWLGSSVYAEDIPLVDHSDAWMYRKGTNAPQPDWKTARVADLDGTWLGPAPGGFGYGDGDDATVLADMRNSYTTVYIRRTFTLSAPANTNLHLVLRMNWDDGFVAWLDGVELSRRNADNTPAGTEPPYDDVARPENHEAGTGVDFGLGLAGNRLGAGDHILAVMGLNDSADSSDLSLIADLFLTDSKPPVPDIITADTTWTAATSPYEVTADTTVADGVTLTIAPGVTVSLSPGASLIVNGRLLAEGTPEKPIVFTGSDTSNTWKHIQFTANTFTSRLSHVAMSYFGNDAIDAAGTTLFLDSVNWEHSTAPVLNLRDSSITLLDSVIPGGGNNEPFHFSGMPTNGHALVRGCIFGAPRGYSDSIDFTGGNRPGPIAQFIDNVFLGGVDDCLDMDGTDAHIEGNIFLDVRKDNVRSSSSSPITTGAADDNLSELVICRNIIYNCEHVLLEKDHGTALIQNNTFVHLTDNPLSHNSGEAPGIILFGEPWRGDPYGDGVIFEGNIGSDLQVADPFPLLTNALAANAGFFFVCGYNCVEGFDQPGPGNLNADPRFIDATGITAENIRRKLALQPGSPCIGTGPNGLDMGALVPAGASIAGAPTGTTTVDDAELTVAGPGIWSYRWRLDGGEWSPEVSLVAQAARDGQPFTADMLMGGVPITISNLDDGVHTVDVIGCNSAGTWQDPGAATTVSWTVQKEARPRISAARQVGQDFELTFRAEAGKSYSLLWSEKFPGVQWLEADRIDPRPTNGVRIAVDPDILPDSTRFYRLVTPAR